MAAIPTKVKRTAFHLFLALSFFTGIYFKQFDIFYPEPFVFIAFCGVLGILIDYIVKIRKQSILWLIPALFVCELLGVLVSKAGFGMVANVLYVPGALLFLVYGVLFIWKGWQYRERKQGIMWKFIILGILMIPLTAWEAITYFPQDFEKALLEWRIVYLAAFTWLIFIDLTTNLKKENGMGVEKEILRYSLLVLAGMYFDRFIFQ